MNKKILGRLFFEKSAIHVAPKLLGKFLIKKEGRKTRAFMITEVEAYDGPNDKASHAHKGRTARTEAMFGQAGHFYVYLCYGMYWMLNVVTGPKDYPAAVLIRGVSSNLRKSDFRRLDFRRLDGPGKITKALSIDKRFNTLQASPKSGLWFEDRGEEVKSYQIKKLPRVGVGYAGPFWSKKKYRFVLSR